MQFLQRFAVSFVSKRFVKGLLTSMGSGTVENISFIEVYMKAAAMFISEKLFQLWLIPIVWLYIQLVWRHIAWLEKCIILINGISYILKSKIKSCCRKLHDDPHSALSRENSLNMTKKHVAFFAVWMTGTVVRLEIPQHIQLWPLNFYVLDCNSARLTQMQYTNDVFSPYWMFLWHVNEVDSIGKYLQT